MNISRNDDFVFASFAVYLMLDAPRNDMRLTLMALALAISTSASAEQSTDSSGDYFMDLGQVYGGGQSIKQYRDICADAFPVFHQQNEKAYIAWRSKYLVFLQEIEKHWTAMAWRESKGDAAKYSDFLAKTSGMFDRYKDVLRKQLSSDGSEQFRKTCALYPQYLASARANLEYFYAEQVITVRKGPRAK
jgi:hypothetical protein